MSWLAGWLLAVLWMVIPGKDEMKKKSQTGKGRTDMAFHNFYLCLQPGIKIKK